MVRIVQYRAHSGYSFTKGWIHSGMSVRSESHAISAVNVIATGTGKMSSSWSRVVLRNLQTKHGLYQLGHITCSFNCSRLTHISCPLGASYSNLIKIIFRVRRLIERIWYYNQLRTYLERHKELFYLPAKN